MFYNELLDSNLVEDNKAGNITPEIDFETHHVVTGGIGFSSDGRDTVSVGKVRELSDVIDIEVIVVSFIGCNSADVVTYPSSTILIKKTNKPIQFFSVHALRECLF